MDWLAFASSTPSKFYNLHWLCCISISINVAIVLIVRVITYRKTYGFFRKGLGIYYIYGLMLFGIAYSWFAFMVGLRFHLGFVKAGRASLTDIILPIRGISLLELFSHIILYYVSMILVKTNGLLILLIIITNCMIQIMRRILLIYLIFMALTIIIAVKSIKTEKRFGNCLWVLIISLCFPATCYLFKTIQLILMLTRY